MSRFKKVAIIITAIELLLLIGFNFYAVKNEYGGSTHTERSYRVDIKRVTDLLKAGMLPEEIDVSGYEYVVRVSEFNPDEITSNSYEVKQVNEKLYKIEYRLKRENGWIIAVNIIMATFVILTAGVLIYINKKILKPFNDMKELPRELAKGNLANPIKQEKSKLFGDYLWGMDMLREKLEYDRARELELLKERKTLVLSLTHDIKTPLSASSLYVKALKSKLYDTEEKRLEALDGIEKNIAEISSYVSEITKSQREDILSLKVDVSEFYLDTVINTIARYYDERMKLRSTEFSVSEYQNCLLSGDSDRVVEVMQNIIENAMKYGDGRKIWIGFDEEEDCKLIRVSNTGSKLLDEDMNHLFDSFYRGSNQEGIKGSGMGLYICKELMHKMDGEVFAEYADDIFTVTLVLRKM